MHRRPQFLKQKQRDEDEDKKDTNKLIPLHSPLLLLTCNPCF